MTGLSSDQQTLSAQNSNIQTFLSSVLFNGLISIGCLAAYNFLRPYYPQVYEARNFNSEVHPDRRSPPNKDYLWSPTLGFGWLFATWRTKDEDLLKRAGMEAYLVVRYLRASLTIFCVSSVLGLVILFPLNSIEGQDLSGLNKFTIGNVIDVNRLWAHTIMVFIFTFFTLYIVLREFRHYIQLRHLYVFEEEHLSNPASRTLLVTNVPENRNSIPELQALFGVLPKGVEHIVLDRYISQLPSLISSREAVITKFESLATAYIIAAAREMNKNKPRASMEPNRSGDGSALGLQPIRHSTSARGKSGVLENGERDGAGDVSSSDQKLRNSTQAQTVVELPYSSHAELTVKRPTIRRSELKHPVLASIPIPAIHSDSTDAFSFLAPAVMETNTRVLQVQESVRSAHAADAATESQLGASSSQIADCFSMSHHLGGLGVAGRKIGSAFDEGTAIVGKAGHTALSALAPLTDLVPLGKKSDLEAPKTGAVFVTFRHPLGLHLAAQALLQEKPFTFGEVIPEVDSEDVLWENLPLDNLSRFFRTAVSIAAAFVVIIFWTFPVAFVTGISTINGLGKAIPFLAGIASWPSVLVGIIQGILPSLFLAILMFLLKAVLRFLAKYEGHATISAMQKSLASRWLAFLVVNVLFVVTLAGGAIPALRAIIDNPPSIFAMLATSLPTVSTFQITYILLQGTSGPAISNLRIGTLIFALPWLSDFLHSTPRKIYTQRANAPEVDYGLDLAPISLIFIIGAAYFAVAPLVSVFAAFFFLVTWVLKKRDYLYVTHNKVETGGKFFVNAMMSMFVGLYIAQVTVAGLMLLTQAWGPAITLLITLAATVLANYFVTKYWSPYFRYVPLDLLRRIPLDTDIGDPAAHDRNTYVHPAVCAGPAFVWLPRDEHGVARGLVDECARAHGLPGTTAGARVYVRHGLAKVKGDVALDVEWDRPLEELGEEAYESFGGAGGGGARVELESGKSGEIPGSRATSVLGGVAGTAGDATLVRDPVDGPGSNGKISRDRILQRSQE